MKEMVKETVGKLNAAKNSEAMITEEYCYSWDGEHYYGEYDSEQEAINEARAEKQDAKYVYIGTCTKPDLRWQSNEEQIIESIAENLSEDVGEAAENFYVDTQDELELARMIDDTVKTWIEQNKIEPGCYAVFDGHMVSIKA